MIQGVFLTFLQGNAFFGLKISFFGFVPILLGAFDCVLILCYTWGYAIQLLCCIIKLAQPTVYNLQDHQMICRSMASKMPNWVLLPLVVVTAHMASGFLW
jgi:hypothetical protein